MLKKTKRTLCIGDIHGGYKALLQVLEKAKFNPDEDRLISLGDICDGWPQTYECIEYLRQLPNFLMILGNHDEWSLNWGLYEQTPSIWVNQGGFNTIYSYKKCPNNKMPESHIRFLAESKLYYHDTKRNFLYIHAGIEPTKSLTEQTRQVLLWDRSFLKRLYMNKGIYESQNLDESRKKWTTYNKIFLGHTTTSHISKNLDPLKCFEVWDLDTGGGWEGRLTVMDVDSEEYWQSDLVKNLYPETISPRGIDYGRNKDFINSEYMKRLLQL